MHEHAQGVCVQKVRHERVDLIFLHCVGGNSKRSGSKLRMNYEQFIVALSELAKVTYQ